MFASILQKHVIPGKAKPTEHLLFDITFYANLKSSIYIFWSLEVLSQGKFGHQWKILGLFTRMRSNKRVGQDQGCGNKEQTDRDQRAAGGLWGAEREGCSQGTASTHGRGDRVGVNSGSRGGVGRGGGGKIGTVVTERQ